MILNKLSLFNGALQQQARNVSLLHKSVISSINTLLEKPKKAGNAYTLFYTEQYPIFKKQFPDFRIAEIAKRIGSKWSSLPEAEKKRYADRQAMGVEGAKQQMAQFKASLNEKQSMALHMLRLHNRHRRGEVTRRGLKEEERAFIQALPKVPFGSGRNLFMSKELKKKEGSLTDRLSAANAIWAALPPSEKAIFENQAKLDQQHFQMAMKKFLNES